MTFYFRPAAKPPGGVGLHRQSVSMVLPVHSGRMNFASLPGGFSLVLGATKLILLEALRERME